jgi:hypothetical protein
MLGFAVAAFFELTQGLDVFQQVKAYPLLTVATFVPFSVASWIPFLQGQSYNVKSGPFTPKVRGGGAAKAEQCSSPGCVLACQQTVAEQLRVSCALSWRAPTHNPALAAASCCCCCCCRLR